MTRFSFALAICGLLILLALGISTFHSTRENESDRGWVTHTHLVIECLQAVEIHITEAETFQRGYLLTGEGGYLSRYDASTKEVGNDLNRLQGLIEDNPAQQAAFARLKSAILARQNALQYRVELRRKRGLRAGIDAMRHNIGEEFMDETRNDITEMRTTEAKLLQIRQALAIETARKLRLFIILGNSFAIALFAIAALFVHRESTRRSRAEQKLTQLNADLERGSAKLSETNAELESFSYSVAHDLRAPLRQISGYCHVLVEDCGPQLDQEASRFLQKIDQGAKRMGQLVDDLLSFSRVGRQELLVERTSLNSILRQVIREHQSECEERSIDWQIGELSDAECDPMLMKQVFTNLISNSVKYTRRQESAMIRVAQAYENGERIISISDNGAGFDMQYAGKLFGVFERLHKAKDFEGTGVGLAIVQRIVRKHGGHIWAQAEEGRGATFHFTLNSAQSNERKQQFSTANQEEIHVA